MIGAITVSIVAGILFQSLSAKLSIFFSPLSNWRNFNTVISANASFSANFLSFSLLLPQPTLKLNFKTLTIYYDYQNLSSWEQKESDELLSTLHRCSKRNYMVTAVNTCTIFLHSSEQKVAAAIGGFFYPFTQNNVRTFNSYRTVQKF